MVACVNDETRSEEMKQWANGTGVGVLKYMGMTVLEDDTPYDFPDKRWEERHHSQVQRLGGEPTIQFYHFSASLANDVPCDYPDVIK